MKLKFHISLLFFLFLFTLFNVVLSGCTHDSTVLNQLKLAESLLDTNTEKSDSILSSISREDIKSKHTLAIYDLLQTEIEYKLYRETLEDSLIRNAIEVFREEKDEQRLMRALFQISIKQYNRGEYPESVFFGLESLDYAEKQDNYDFIAKITEHLATVFNNNYNHVDALKFIDTSIENYVKIGKDLNVLYAQIAKGKIIRNLGDFQNSLNLLDSLDYSEYKNDSLLIVYLYQSKIDPLLALSETHRAKDVVDTIQEYSSSTNRIDDVYLLSVKIACEEYEEADSLINLITLTEHDLEKNARFQEALAEYYYKTGQNDSSFQTLKKVVKMQRLAINRTFSNSLEKEQKRYVEKKLNSAELEKQSIRLILFLSLGVACLLFTLFFIFHKYQLKKRSEIIDSKMAEIAEMTSDTNSRLYAIFKARIELINGLCERYFLEKDAKDKYQAKTYREVCYEIKKFNSPESISEIIRFLNESKDNIVAKLDTFELKPQVRLVVIYTLLGLKARSIAILCDLSTSNVYTIRTRIRGIFQNSKSEYANEIAQIFE